MIDLDESQLNFCRSSASRIRLLAPAGCGKTASLLHRCLQLTERVDRRPRFLLVTFTRGAAAELADRLNSELVFSPLRGQANITTLNAYGWNRIRSRVKSPRLLSSRNDQFFAMKNQLHPLWADNPHIEPVVTKPGGNAARQLMTVMDNLKSMGFVHTTHVNRNSFNDHLDALERQGLSERIVELFEMLTDLGVLDSPAGDGEGPATSRRQFYDRFFTFWRKATARLLAESTFTYEDQKYWACLDLQPRTANGKVKPRLSGAARYDHVLVDEFQDVNPLDLALVRAIVRRNRATLTIVGDDDQAIFEWRGATPEYILNPHDYLGGEFTDYLLATNYRSPRNIVYHSQRLIANNTNRVSKSVEAREDSPQAQIELLHTDGIGERLQLVTEIAQNVEYPGRVAVIGRLRRQLIPYQIHFAAQKGAPFNTAVDLDVFGSKAFSMLETLLAAWERSDSRMSVSQATRDAIEIVDRIRRLPLGKRDRAALTTWFRRQACRTARDAIASLGGFKGKLSGKSHQTLCEYGSEFFDASDVAGALRCIGKRFDGLKFDWIKAEEDVFFTAPPLEQLADIVDEQRLGVADLVDRIDAVKSQTEEYRELKRGEDDSDIAEFLGRPLHLMTATRSKGREFDTVILLDTVDGIWPFRRAENLRDFEAERRLFYVAFTRASRRVVMLASGDTGLTSPFVEELGLD